MNIYFIGEEDLFINKSIKKSSISEAYDYLKDQKVISLDIETTRKFNNKYGEGEGLSPYLSKIVMVQIGTLDRQYIIDHRVYKLGILTSLLENKDIVKVGHNIKFEYSHILHNYGIYINNMYDTQIVEQILYCGDPTTLTYINGRLKGIRRYSLEALNYIYLNEEVDKSTRLEFLTIKSKPFSLRQIHYGADDIINPLKIKEKQVQKIIDQNLASCIELEMLFIQVLGDLEYKGMHFNKDKWQALYDKNLPILYQRRKKLNSFVEDNYGNSKFVTNQLDLFNTKFKSNILWSSAQQTVKFLVYLNICPKEYSKSTKKIDYTANGKTLKASLNTINKDKDDNIKQFIKNYVEYKEIEQLCTTFGIEFFKYINPVTNRIHSNYKQILNTGRISSSNPNLQNIPSIIDFRKCFDIPEGRSIVNADYSGQEQIVLANKSQDKSLLEFYDKGLGDMHSYVCSKIFPEELTFEELSDMLIKKDNKLPLDSRDKELLGYRQIAKAAGFAINYGGNGYTIAKNLGILQSKGEEVYNSYFEAFPGLLDYFTKTQRDTLRRGYIIIDEVTKRKSYFDRPITPKEISSVKKKALNYPKIWGFL